MENLWSDTLGNRRLTPWMYGLVCMYSILCLGAFHWITILSSASSLKEIEVNDCNCERPDFVNWEFPLKGCKNTDPWLIFQLSG